MEKAFLVGERLYLRPLDECDLDRCLCWINDGEILTTLGRRTPMSRSMEREWLLGQYKDDTTFSLAIVLRDGDRHIGNAGLHGIQRVDRSAEFGLLVGDKTEWGKGYGTQAGRLVIDHGFRQLGLHRIWLRVFAFNERAHRVYEKIGFTHEGVLRESYYAGGTFHDTVVMSILASEWKSDEASVVE
ncbi:MAG: GNAT family N-acetyltransferase [Candidatus Bipolaricaulota bacterium]|nr:MAG: GNAT family N-acetyltransferase [Candidatus Bipolaricaulota bacterium]